jgi:hypothetical protein
MNTRLLLSALAITGCAKTDSSDLLSTGIYAAISAKASGDGTTDVYTTLYVGNPLNLNFVDLTGDDQLVASHGSQEKVMSETILLNIVSHKASFPTDAEGDQFQVAFERSIDAGAPNSIVTLPSKFTLDPAPTTASRAANLSLTWAPIDSSPNIMRWELRGDCIENESQILASDTGSLSIEANRIRKRMGEMVADECPMTITVIRGRPGQLDPGYGKGGVVEGQQVRRVMLTTTL